MKDFENNLIKLIDTNLKKGEIAVSYYILE